MRFKHLRVRPLVVITVLVVALTLAFVAIILRSTYEHPTYTIHRTFQTQEAAAAFAAELSGMPGVWAHSTGIRIGPGGAPVEGEFKVTAPAGFPYGTADYNGNSVVVFPIVVCLLVLGTLWGFAIQRRTNREDHPGIS